MNISHLIKTTSAEIKQIPYSRILTTYGLGIAAYLGCLMAIFPINILLSKANASFLTYPLSLYSLELICTYYIARLTKLIPNSGWPSPRVIGHYNIVVSILSVVITVLGSLASQSSVSAFFIYGFYLIFVTYLTMASSFIGLVYSIIRRSKYGFIHHSLALLILSALFLVNLTPISY